jgi:hypothetical protein
MKLKTTAARALPLLLVMLAGWCGTLASGQAPSDAALCYQRCSTNADCASSPTCKNCDPTTRTCKGNPMCRWRCFSDADCVNNLTYRDECQRCVVMPSGDGLCGSPIDADCVADADCLMFNVKLQCLGNNCIVPAGASTCGYACTAANASSTCGWPCDTCSAEGRCVAGCGTSCEQNSDCAAPCGFCVQSPFPSVPKYCAAFTDPTTLPPTTTTTTTPAPPTMAPTAAPTTPQPPPPTTASTSPPTTTGVPLTTATPNATPSPASTPSPTRSDQPQDSGAAPAEPVTAVESRDATITAALLPVGVAFVVLALTELVLCACYRRRGRGHVVLGVHIAADDDLTVRVCWTNTRHTSASYAAPVRARSIGDGLGIGNSDMLVGGVVAFNNDARSHADSDSPRAAVASPRGPKITIASAGSTEVGDSRDVLIACAIAEAIRTSADLKQFRLAGIVLTAPGTSFEHGELTSGAHPAIVAALSAAVKAKGLLCDGGSGIDGSLTGVQVCAPSVALAAACAAAFRVLGENERRAATATTYHMAVNIGSDETTCCTFAVVWDS